MALQGTGPRLYRMQKLLRQYLNTEIDAIDAAATTHTGVGDDSFTVQTLEDADIQVFRDDREAECVVVVIVPTGARRPRDLTKHGAGTNQSRYDTDHEFAIYVTARSSTGSWGEHGAWLRADRVAHGVTACLLKWPTLDVPAASLEKLAVWTEVDDWDRMPTENEADTLSVSMVARVTVRTMEQIA